MIDLIGLPPILENLIMDCQGNHAFSHSPNLSIFEDNFVLHLGGANEQFGIHEKFF